MASVGSLPNGDVHDSIMTEMNGPESFAVIDPDSPNSYSNNNNYQVDDSFVFGFAEMQIDDMAVKVHDLASENQRLKELLDQSNHAMETMSERITKRVVLLNKQKADVEQENTALKTDVKDAKDQIGTLEKELAFSQQACEDLRREMQLSAACVDEQADAQLHEQNDSLRQENDKLKADLQTTKTSMDDLLKDMEESQKLKSDVQDELANAKTEIKRLNDEIAKLEKIREKVQMEKQDVVKINIQLQAEVEALRRETMRLESMPISLVSSNFPRMREDVGTGAEGASDGGTLTDVTDAIPIDMNDGHEGYTPTGGETIPKEVVPTEMVPNNGHEHNNEQNQNEENPEGEESDEDNSSYVEARETRIDDTPDREATTEDPLLPGSSDSPGRVQPQMDRSTSDPSSVSDCELPIPGMGGPVMNSMKSSSTSVTTSSSTREDVHRILEMESLMTAEGRQELTQKMELLFDEVAHEKTKNAELQEEIILQRETLTDQIRKLEEELNAHKDQMDSQERHLVDLNTRNAMLMKKKEHLEARILALQTTGSVEMEERQRSDDRRSVERQLSQERRSSGFTEEGDLKWELANLKKKCATLERENINLKTLGSAQQLMSEARTEHTNKLNANHEQLRADRDKLLEQRLELKRECEREIQENQHLESVTKDLRDQIEDLTRELELMVEQQDQMDVIAADRNQLQKELTEQRNQTDALCHDYHQRSTTNEQLMNQIAQKEVECDEYRKDIANLHKENERLNEELNKVKDELELLRATSSGFENDFNEERESRQNIKLENDDLQLQLHNLQSHLLDLQARGYPLQGGQGGQEYVPPHQAHPQGYPDYAFRPYPAAQQPYPMQGQGYPQGQGQGYPQGQGQGYPQGQGQGYPQHGVGAPAQPRSPDHQALQVPEVGENECPMCFERFPGLLQLQEHVQDCVI